MTESDRGIKILHQAQHPVEVLDVALIQSLFEDYDIQYCFTEGGEKLDLRMYDGGEYGLGRLGEMKRATVRHMTLTYLTPSHEEEGSYFTNHSQFFAPGDIAGAAKALVDRAKVNPLYSVPGSSKKLDELYRQQSGELFYESHYDYLDAMLTPFWKEVFGKTPDEMWCGGIVGSHGDKAYSHKSEWASAGISFGHGVLLFLLTYTKELGDTPKYESYRWVIDNYPKYFQQIIRAENTLLRSIGFKGPFPLEIFKRDSGETADGYEGWVFYQNGQPVNTIEGKTEVEVMTKWLESKNILIPA